MNKIKSEVLFNRGLLWFVLAYVRLLCQEVRPDANGKIAPLMFLVAAVYNFYRSWRECAKE